VRYAVILAGGRGTRFWPKSRAKTPKQLLPLLGSKTLLAETVERLRPVVPPERMWVLTNQQLRRAIRRQAPEIPARQVLAEPVQRNTAPALGLASQVIHELDPDAVLGVFPADQHIARPAEFRKVLGPAYRAAEEGCLVTLGVTPRWAETGYGYLEFPPEAKAGEAKPWPLRSFREKPDLATAEQFVASGRFYWNAGIFFWRTRVFLKALRRHLPRTASVLASLPPPADRRFGARLRETFPRCESISVDFAVMEKAENVAGIPAGDIGWSDVGSWKAVFELSRRDAQDNAARTELLALESRGNFVEAPGKLVALLGVEDLVVVDTPDALLVARRERTQQVGELVKQLEKRRRDELL